MQLMHGDCLDLMAQIPDGSVDMIMCDLPLARQYVFNKQVGCSSGAKFKRIPLINRHISLGSIFKPSYKSDIGDFKPTSIGLWVDVVNGWIKPLVFPIGDPQVIDSVECRVKVKPIQKLLSNGITGAKVLKVARGYSGKELELVVRSVLIKVDGCSKSAFHVLSAKRFCHGFSRRPHRSTLCGSTNFCFVLIRKHAEPSLSRDFNPFFSKDSLNHVVVCQELIGYLPKSPSAFNVEPDYFNIVHFVSHLFADIGMHCNMQTACANTGREFIGIEKDAHYFSIATERIESAKLQLFAGVAA